MYKTLNNTILIFMLTILVSICGCSSKNTDNTITGEVSVKETDVSVKIPGRLLNILVEEGDSVKQNQLLAIMESKELEAKISSAQGLYNEAKEQFTLAEKTYNRMENLFNQNVIAKQQLDEATYKYQASQEKMKITKGQLDEVMSYFDETKIKSPLDGEVVEIVSSKGELVASGYPIITIMDPSNIWITLNILENKMNKMKLGNKISAYIPALNETYDFSITYISPLGAFAKWKATNEQGSFDIKTFEIRAKPAKKIDGLRPGMTVLAKIK